ncbi:MAG: Uncharacterized protein G01um10145_222 [Microgenomates group bacterium Gr01-1014_5]|nr:MAG: Uncharacterized protein G01um10145_222 [Microgenomates group bacterium Gr01-1014_5]
MRKSKQTYQQFLEKRHSKHQVSEGLLSKIVEKATGQKTKTRERLIKGENSEVYDIKTDDSQEIVIRICRNEWSDYEAETWAIGKCKELGLPVPRVLFVGEITDGTETVRVSVLEKLPGVSLGEIKSGDKKTLKNIVLQAGEMLSTIHTIKLTKFGGLDKEGNGRFETYREYIEDRLDKVDKFGRSEAKTGISDKLIQKALKIIKANDAVFDEVSQSVLLHNDFSPKHILVANGKITGIIDFETVHGGYPLQEMARWDYYWGEKFPLSWLVEGYKNKELIGDDFDFKIHLFRMIFCLHVSVYYAETGNNPGLDHAKVELVRDLEYFKKARI